MCNPIHILLEVPPMPAGGLSDAELLKRLRAIYSELEVAVVEKRLAEIRLAIAEGRADEALTRGIHERFTYRMHDLGEYLKTLLGRFTSWFNGSQQGDDDGPGGCERIHCYLPVHRRIHRLAGALSQQSISGTPVTSPFPRHPAAKTVTFRETVAQADFEFRSIGLPTC